MYNNKYDMEEYVIGGTRSDSLPVNVYIMSGLNVRGFFTILWRDIFGTSTPKNNKKPEDIVEEAEKRGKCEVLAVDDGVTFSFVVKKLEKAYFKHSYANIDFGDRFQ